MATEVIMPALGMAQEVGILVSWLKAEGESVARGEPLMEIETDKATVEVEAPASGILADVSAAAGDEVPVGRAIAVILAPGELAAKDNKPKSKSSSAPTAPSRVMPPSKPTAEVPLEAKRLRASPAARRIAKEKGLDLSAVKGSGPQGAVVADDVQRAAKTPTSQPEGRPKPIEIVPLSAMRRIVGQRMTQSKQTAPHFYVAVDVDMTEVGRQRAEGKKHGANAVPSINDFILRACAQALKEFPSLNAAFTEQGIRLFSDINIGMAVALEEGLVAPVIRGADRLSLQELSRQSRELIEKAQKKKLLPLDYEGGTFTVSNLGMLGVDSFTAIINPPQCAILAVAQVAPRVVPDGDDIVVRPMMTMTLSADHRIVDGAIAARFLQRVKALLQEAAD